MPVRPVRVAMYGRQPNRWTPRVHRAGRMVATRATAQVTFKWSVARRSLLAVK